jgi:hypothetical protein
VLLRAQSRPSILKRKPAQFLWIIGATAALALIIVFIVFSRPGEQGAQSPPIVTDEPAVEPTSEATSVASPTVETTVQDEPTPVLTGPGFADVEGEVVFRNAQVTASLSQVAAPPAESVYEAWLIEPDGAPLSLGIVDVSGGTLVVDFTDPAGHPP